MKKYGIKVIHTTPYNPTGNSVSERINRTIGELLRIYKGERLKKILNHINTRLQRCYHRTIGMTPTQLIERIKINPTVIQQIQQRLINQQQSREDKVNKKRTTHVYKHGDQVYYKKHTNTKFEPLYEGPYVITDVSQGPNVFTIQGNSKSIRTNVKRIRPIH